MRHTKWAEDYLRDMGFRPCEAYPDLWMRRKANYYEYVAVMVDDLLVFSQEPELIMEQKAAAATIPTNTLLAISPTMMPPMITPAPPIPPEPPPDCRSDSYLFGTL